MWVRYVKNIDGARRGDVIWTDDDDLGEELIDDGAVVRCTGPDGRAFGEVAPEDVTATIQREEELKSERSQ